LKPEKVRVSVGTAAVLGLIKGRLDVKPTTAYLMTYTEGSCIANCSFCPQARGSPSDKSLLSRVLWPEYATGEVVERIANAAGKDVERVCIQAINYPGFIEHVLALIEAINERVGIPLSLDSPPLSKNVMEKMRLAGLERISFPLDAATPDLFDRVKGQLVKGPYRWERQLEALRAAVNVFGPGNAMSNLIVGLGETEEEAIGLIQRLKDMDVEVSLFAFTPIRGTVLADRPQPPLDVYRRIQLARYLIVGGLARLEEMEFDEEGRATGFGARGEKFQEALDSGEAFRTSGCPGCNRPYYNERPSGPFYNYPRELTEKEARREAELMGLTLEE
jgi:biotin synthase-related radical SAM superfamily protein